jgi:HK97 family phage portal protein
VRYTTESGLQVEDRRHSRSDDPRSWPSNPNVDPPPPTGPGVGPNMSEGFGNSHVMYSGINPPPVMPWSGWPTEWNTPNWGGAMGMPEMIQRSTAAYGAIDMNSSILSTMPPYRLSGRVVIDPLPWMSNPQPEVYTGWTEAMKQVITSYYGGEAFLWATNRYADGTVRNWVMLNPEWVSVDMMGHVRSYSLGDKARGGIDISADVLHLRYMSWPGYPHGMGPLAALATTIFGVQAMEQYVANLAIRGGIPWGVLTAPGNLNEGQATELRTAFVNARMSAMGAPAVLSGGVTLTQFSISPRDMALLELRQFDEARISTLLGVPPLLQGLPEGSTSMTYKNAEGIYDFHWRAFLKPKAATIAEAISNWALNSNQSIELNRDDYVKGSASERAVIYQTLFAIVDPITGKRAISVDEIREAERLAVLDDPTPDPSLLPPVTPPPPAALPPGPAPPSTGNALSTTAGQGSAST